MFRDDRSAAWKRADPPRVGDPLHDLLAAAAVATVDEHMPTLRAEPLGNDAADAVRGAGDQSDAIRHGNTSAIVEMDRMGFCSNMSFQT